MSILKDFMVALLPGPWTDISYAISTRIAAQAFDDLEEKYSVHGGYFVLDEKIKNQFKRCLKIATNTFLEHVKNRCEVGTATEYKIAQYMKSPAISEQISHLLDPGAEVFDRGEATQALDELFSEEYSISKLKEVVFDAWEEFLKAYSFASRSTPELREFLRASYEAGSFRSLSNIEESLNQLGEIVSGLSKEEVATEKAIEKYVEELKAYRDWASSYRAEKALDKNKRETIHLRPMIRIKK